MHFTHRGRGLGINILETAQMDPRIRNYSPMSMSSCGLLSVIPINTNIPGQGGWFPGGTGVPAPGFAGPVTPGPMGPIPPGGVGLGGPLPPALGATGSSLPGKPHLEKINTQVTQWIQKTWCEGLKTG